MTKFSELAIQIAVANTLEGWRLRAGITSTHVANELPFGGKIAMRQIQKLKAQGMRPGWPDNIICLPYGRVIHIELKTKTGAMSAVQQDVRLALEALGHTYHLVKAGTPGEAADAVDSIIWAEMTRLGKPY